jgi:hypothetical protein
MCIGSREVEAWHCRSSAAQQTEQSINAITAMIAVARRSIYAFLNFIAVSKTSERFLKTHFFFGLFDAASAALSTSISGLHFMPSAKDNGLKPKKFTFGFAPAANNSLATWT